MFYQNKLDKARFQQEQIREGFKDLCRRIVCEKRLRDKTFNIAKYPKYDKYQLCLASMVYIYFDL